MLTVAATYFVKMPFGKHKRSLLILTMAALVIVGTDLAQRCQRREKPSLLGVVLLRSIRRYNFLRGWLIILFPEITHHPVKGHLDPVGKKEPNAG